MAGYSHTPLAKKLGIAAGANVSVINTPKDYRQWLGAEGLPFRFVSASNPKADIVHIFTTKKLEFFMQFKQAKPRIFPDGALWVSWPKKTSTVKTDLNENIIRAYGLKQGLVDVKVCAVNEIWSGLKFVYRTKDRKTLR